MFVALLIAESLLRFLPLADTQSQDLDEGLIESHPRLGWQLASNWRGSHHHSDYDATYRTTPFRTRATGGLTHGAGDLLIIGDSFTFGLGVSDEDTFAWQLQRLSNQSVSNFGVPGTSPDQHLLRLEPLNLRNTERVLMVIYLGNDLLDLTRDRPLQAPYAKPFFAIQGDRLRLENVPTPAGTTEPGLAASSITDYLLEGSTWSSRFALIRYLRSIWPPARRDMASFFAQRFADERSLFTKILATAKLHLRTRGATLEIALMPGREFYANPEGAFAVYQQQAAREISAAAQAAGVNVINLADVLEQAAYFPVDGHLNPYGHCLVATDLAGRLDSLGLTANGTQLSPCRASRGKRVPAT